MDITKLAGTNGICNNGLPTHLHLQLSAGLGARVLILYFCLFWFRLLNASFAQPSADFDDLSHGFGPKQDSTKMLKKNSSSRGLQDANAGCTISGES